MDFYRISTVESKKGNTIYPELEYGPSTDLMIRGHDFYAIWDEQNNRWSQNGNDMIDLIDSDLRQRAAEIEKETGDKVKIQLCRNFNSQVWHNIRKYFANSFDIYHQLDEDLTFANTETTKKDYRSKRLPYALLAGDYSGYDELMDTLYDPDERDKLEWAIGAIVAGKAKYIQKFIVLYGEAGTGKSTVLDIIQQLFPGYYVTFDAKALGSANRQFATEVFRSDPLVAIQHDGDLSKIESNETLNSVVSHEEMTMHVKYRSDYSARVNAFLFMGTNKPVKITDAKSGIIRRLIDVTPSGRKLPYRKYQEIMRHKIPFELGAIAWHCKEVFEELGENYYDKYRPVNMMFQTDPFINFIELNCFEFERDDYITLNRAWAMYKEYCDDSALQFKLPRHTFRGELQNYFKDFRETWRDPEGRQLRSVYIGFLKEKLQSRKADEDKLEKTKRSRRKKDETRLDFGDNVDIRDGMHNGSIATSPDECDLDSIGSSIFDQLVLNCTSGELDIELAECPAQYASDRETPVVKWENCRTKLKDLDPTKLHYVRPPENIICIDFDLKDENGQKSWEKNLEAASKWPATYAEFSKGGAGIHLIYKFVGDVEKLSALYAPEIEIKKFTGKSSLRRKLTLCNSLPVAVINSGLPMKEAKKVVNTSRIASEKGLRDLIKRNLRKEIHQYTKPSVQFIYQILEDAYNRKDFIYNVEDMRGDIVTFAAKSHNNADFCLRLANMMKYKSENDGELTPDDKGAPMVVFDVESFKNVFMLCWKRLNEGDQVVKWVNPTPSQIEELMQYRLIGHNIRRYDVHMVFGCYLGETPYQLYLRSQKLISGEAGAGYIREAFSIGYADTYDFASAANKKKLKRWEIELGLHHLENQYPWDEPLPEEHWEECLTYCANDVIATEALFNHLQSDFIAREILAEIAEMPVFTTTNNLTAKIIFGNNKHPKTVYTDLKTGEQY